MKKNNYLNHLQEARYVSKFNTVYQSIMGDLNLYKNIKQKPITNFELNLLLEDIDKPQYIVCESSGEAILLEDAIFMDEQYLISEGIFDTVTKKVKEIIEKIKQGIAKILIQSAGVIKSFCEKIKSNAVVAAIIKKLNLDGKLTANNIKQYVSIKTSKKAVNEESVVFEATKLSKAEEAITDSKELEEKIKKYQAHLQGTKKLKNAKTGKVLTDNYVKSKLNLFKKKLNVLNAETNNSDADTTDSKDKSTENNKEKTLGKITVDTAGLKEYIATLVKEATADKTAQNAAQVSVQELGGDKIIDGNTKDSDESDEPKQTKEKEQKKGFLSKLKNTASKAANAIGNNVVKPLATKAMKKLKSWWDSQSGLVKGLIKLIIGVLAFLAIVSFIIGLFSSFATFVTGAFLIYRSIKNI